MPTARQALRGAGFEAALRHVCEWALPVGGLGSGSSSGIGAGIGGVGMSGRGVEGDRDVVEQARTTLRLLE